MAYRKIITPPRIVDKVYQFEEAFVMRKRFSWGNSNINDDLEC